jgi:hypothetical protein
LYRSTNGGKSLVAIGCGLDRVLCMTYAGDQRTFYAGGHSGVVRSTDAGVSWQPSGPGLDSVNVTCIVHDASSGTLYCGTAEAGAYELEVATAVVNTVHPALPVAYTLRQNYPNPFNPSTTISYAIPQASNVRLSIFNVLGEEIHTLVNEFEDAGYKSVSFDASSFPSGVYFYRIVAKAVHSGQADNFTETKKLVLLK